MPLSTEYVNNLLLHYSSTMIMKAVGFCETSVPLYRTIYHIREDNKLQEQRCFSALFLKPDLNYTFSKIG
jgi:hypothetical protein